MNIDRLTHIFDRNTAERDYAKDLASWQIANDANRNDMTPSQDERYRLHNRTVDAGLDAKHIAYAQWLVRNGRVQP